MKYCPAFWTHLDALSPMLEFGAQIVFSEVESNTGGSIGTQRANDHMNPYTPNGSGIRSATATTSTSPTGSAAAARTSSRPRSLSAAATCRSSRAIR